MENYWNYLKLNLQIQSHQVLLFREYLVDIYKLILNSTHPLFEYKRIIDGPIFFAILANICVENAFRLRLHATTSEHDVVVVTYY